MVYSFGTSSRNVMLISLWSRKRKMALGRRSVDSTLVEFPWAFCCRTSYAAAELAMQLDKKKKVLLFL